ncbi:hypothetical protein RHECNPAF_850035 [Rhizobium etli CNPAF512]|nr:hypothetical protein RHECNPAF_850035 [Rhizobium etli CNPAF512]
MRMPRSAQSSSRVLATSDMARLHTRVSTTPARSSRRPACHSCQGTTEERAS